MKHILALTYRPKISDVRFGKCTQTIRPHSDSKPKKVGDMVMFHGWEGKPYRSKWGWRTPYWKIIDVYMIKISPSCIKSIDPIDDVFKNYDPIFDVPHSEPVTNIVAKWDGFKNYDSMYQQFKKMYGDKLDDILFDVITWKFEEKEEY